MPTKLTDYAAQVEAFRKTRPLFGRLAKILEGALAKIGESVSLDAIVQVRVKSVASFAEKILRKKKYAHPLREITDLCGARVVTPLESEVAAICARLREAFEIDEVNSLDQLSRLRPREFGYRSVHYVVRLRRDRFPRLPQRLYTLKAEIQVRTFLQHAWSAVGHDRLYKTGHRMPDVVQREASRIAAQLESVDDDFQRLVTSVQELRVHFGGGLDRAQLEDDQQLQAALRCHDPDNPAVPLRQAQLALAQEDWALAIRTVRSFRGKRTAALDAALGFAICRQHSAHPRTPRFRAGVRLLERATAKDPWNSLAWMRRGEVLAAVDGPGALDCYRRVFAIDPSDPAALSGYTRLQLQENGDTRFVEPLRPTLLAAIKRCEAQAGIGLELPWAHFRAAGFHLLLGPDQMYAALESIARGVAQARGQPPIADALHGTALLCRVHPRRPDARAARRFLQLALAVEGGNEAAQVAVRRMATRGVPPIRGPVVIVAGACDPRRGENFSDYRAILREAFQDFSGTVISGGTRQGVAGLVGELRAAARGRIHTIGYLPRHLPADGSATHDVRYHEIRRSPAETFGPFEPLQNWIDLIASGIPPSSVTVLGLGGGRIAAFEYRLALALGARVGIVADTGREADGLVVDPEWQEHRRLLRLSRGVLDAATMRAFMHPPSAPAGIDLDQLGGLVHETYLRRNLYSESDPVRREWSRLRGDLKASNREQIAYAAQILASEGYTLVATPVDEVKLPRFTRSEIERMAALEHGRWNVERLAAGWRHGPQRDAGNRITPYLTPWRTLPEGVKQFDRDAIANYANILRRAGWAIVKQ